MSSNFLFSQNMKSFNPPIILAHNQRKIFNLLLKLDDFINLTTKSDYLENTEKMIEGDSLTLDNHLELICLLSKIANRYKLAIIQLQKILFNEQLISLLTNKSSKFLIKRAYLRCFLNVYLIQIDDLNKDISCDDMYYFLENVILADISLFPRYFFLSIK